MMYRALKVDINACFDGKQMVWIDGR